MEQRGHRLAPRVARRLARLGGLPRRPGRKAAPGPAPVPAPHVRAAPVPAAPVPVALDPVSPDPALVPIIGLTRFTVLTEVGSQYFSAGRGVSFEAYVERHLQERRLRYRLDVLLQDGLPQMARAAEAFPLFRHVVFHSTLLPRWVIDELSAAVEDHPFLVLAPVAPDASPRQRAEPWLQGLPWPVRAADTGFGAFRIDDDDMVAADYLRRLAAYVVPAEAGRCVSFGTGYAVPYDVEARRASAAHVVVDPLSSAGLAYIGTYSPSRVRVTSKYSFPPGKHRHVHELVPTVLDSRAPAWLRLHSDDQDTTLATQRSAAERLAKFPEASWADVHQAFPASRLVADALAREQQSSAAPTGGPPGSPASEG